jgi:transcriptional regulator
VWREFARDPEALVIFQGPGTYVSPSLYVSKDETGMVVPTWNYAVVHAYGPMRVIDDRAWLRRFVEKLTSMHESRRPQPWKVTDAPADFIEKQLEAIVGIEIPITRLSGKYKVSQNRSTADRDGVVQGLSKQGGESATAIADLVRERRDK